MDSRVDIESTYWLELLRHSPLAVLTDLDGTLLPFARRPEEARPTPTLASLVRELSTVPGVTLAVVSGRPRDVLDGFFPTPRALLLMAEHGAWRAGPEKWEKAISADEGAVDSLLAELRRLHAKYPNALLERKTWSIAFHYRMVPEPRKGGLLVQLSAVLDAWLAAHPLFERLFGAEVVEIRPRAARKSNAVEWMRTLRGPDCRLVIIGDDTTDEDMFAAAGVNDATVCVTSDPARITLARWRLESTDAVHAFYRDIVAIRGTQARRPSVRPAAAVSAGPTHDTYGLLVVSNRLPELRSAEASPQPRRRTVGGLVSALKPVLETQRGLWLGWSGRTCAEPVPTDVRVDRVQGLVLASVDFPDDWHRRYYNGFSNSALWPLLHSFASHTRFAHSDWDAYVQANAGFAEMAAKLVPQSAAVWVHDYHLFLLGQQLRARGHRGPIGFFQHIPFPGPDIFFLLPWAGEILQALLDFDLVGFHTTSYVHNFLHCMERLPGARIVDGRVTQGARTVDARAFPLGIVPEEFHPDTASEASEEIRGLLTAIAGKRLVLGVDRLDYTKGIPERIDAFGRLLQTYPEWRRKVSLVQVSVPSRADIAEYAEQRSRVENSVGRINGEFGEADWVPIRYLYRSYGRAELTQLYRAADVGYVTPLRDGMNLVAKEFVAAQDPDKPGVLLLSRFAGAAEELGEALLTNPWDAEGTARDLDRALRMPPEERARRHGALARVVSSRTALTWAEEFLAALGATGRP
jgi:trehalose 6-phosphate synthase